MRSNAAGAIFVSECCGPPAAKAGDAGGPLSGDEDGQVPAPHTCRQSSFVVSPKGAKRNRPSLPPRAPRWRHLYRTYMREWSPLRVSVGGRETRLPTPELLPAMAYFGVCSTRPLLAPHPL